jgi:hypothetical protein
MSNEENVEVLNFLTIRFVKLIKLRELPTINIIRTINVTLNHKDSKYSTAIIFSITFGQTATLTSATLNGIKVERSLDLGKEKMS